MVYRIVNRYLDFKSISYNYSFLIYTIIFVSWRGVFFFSRLFFFSVCKFVCVGFNTFFCLSDCIFVCASLSLFVNNAGPMDLLSLLMLCRNIPTDSIPTDISPASGAAVQDKYLASAPGRSK